MGRLTKKIKNPQYSNDYEMLCAHEYHAINKLGKIEDLMEKYHIRDVEHLDRILEEYEFAKLGKIFPSHLQQLDKEESE